jgi:ATP-dependent DNA ligase
VVASRIIGAGEAAGAFELGYRPPALTYGRARPASGGHARHAAAMPLAAFRRRGAAFSRPLAGFIEPCLPRPVDRPPIGGDWLHEIKHDGFRIMARRDAAGVRLLTRNGYDFAGRFPLAAAAVAALSARSCLIDGEAIVTDQKGLAVFDLIRAGRQPSAARFYAPLIC